MNQRSIEILQLLSKRDALDVGELAALLNVSSVTVRKDVNALEEKGLLKRQHGRIVRVSTDDVGFRMIFDYDVKQRIARRAAQLVSSGDTIMIESGSTCALLAEEIAKTRTGVTIITNSAFICQHIRAYRGAQAVLLGGLYDPAAQVMTGPLVELCAKQFHVRLFFIGVDGYDTEQGFSNVDLSRAESVRAMAACANETVALIDLSKFGRRSVVKLLRADEVSAVVCDAIPDDCRLTLEDKAVRVILA